MESKIIRQLGIGMVAFTMLNTSESISATPPAYLGLEIPQRAIVKPSEPIVGQKKGLIILVDFADRKFTVGNPTAWADSVANASGYSVGDYRGSVSDYFRDQSRGLLSLTFDVVGPVSMPKNLSYYGEKTPIRPDAHAGEMIAEACRMASGSVDFKDYDWDGNGEVEMVFVIYAGYGEHVSHDTSLIWPKQGTLTLSDWGKPLEIDGVTIDTFACSCELNGSSGSEPTGIGAICHEFSHCFGLPDLYDKYGIGFGMGDWSLMDTGMYNANGYVPAGFTAYERWYSGWMELIELKEPVSIRGMKPLADGGEAYIVRNDAHPDEYYILENRQPVGWDSALPGRGLLITHVDFDASEWRFNSVNSDDRHPRYYAVAADGRRDEETMSGDPFPYGSNTSFTDFTSPKAKLYNSASDGRNLLGKPISGIRQNPDGTVDFDFMSPDASVDQMSEVTMTVDVYSPQGVLYGRGISREKLSLFSGVGLVILTAPDGRAEKIIL